MIYPLYILGVYVAKTLPLKACYLLAGIIARGYYFLAGRDRKEMIRNFRVVLGEDASEAEIKRHVIAVFRNFAKYLVDFFKFSRLDRESISRYVTLEGAENIDRCLAEGKGAIIVSLHLGNWELGGALVGSLGYPVSGIVLEHKDSRVNDFFVKQRAINGLRSVPLGTKIKKCFRALKKNECVAIVGDKDYTSNGVSVEFFGKKAVLPKGPAVFALRTGAPIVFCATVRKEDDSFLMFFEEPLKLEPSGDTHKDVINITRECSRFFEKVIRKYPDQWYAFRSVWGQ